MKKTATKEVKQEDVLQTIKKSVAVVVKEADNTKIKTAEDMEQASAILVKVRSYKKRIDERRLEITRPIEESLKKIREEFNKTKEPLEKLESEITEEMKKYRAIEAEKIRKAQEKERERQRKEFEKEQERKRKELEKQKAEMSKKEIKEAEKEIAQEEFIPTAPTVTQDKTIRTMEGNIRARKVWKFEVMNEQEVPRAFLKVDEVLIGKMVRSGELRECPGVRIYEEEVI